MSNLRFNVHVLPALLEHFAPTHAGVESTDDDGLEVLGQCFENPILLR